MECIRSFVLACEPITEEIYDQSVYPLADLHRIYLVDVNFAKVEGLSARFFNDLPGGKTLRYVQLRDVTFAEDVDYSLPCLPISTVRVLKLMNCRPPQMMSSMMQSCQKGLRALHLETNSYACSVDTIECIERNVASLTDIYVKEVIQGELLNRFLSAIRLTKLDVIRVTLAPNEKQLDAMRECMLYLTRCNTHIYLDIQSSDLSASQLVGCTLADGCKIRKLQYYHKFLRQDLEVLSSRLPDAQKLESLTIHLDYVPQPTLLQFIQTLPRAPALRRFTLGNSVDDESEAYLGRILKRMGSPEALSVLVMCIGFEFSHKVWIHKDLIRILHTFLI
jgi:hypothetical protein